MLYKLRTAFRNLEHANCVQKVTDNKESLAMTESRMQEYESGYSLFHESIPSHDENQHHRIRLIKTGPVRDSTKQEKGNESVSSKQYVGLLPIRSDKNLLRVWFYSYFTILPVLL